MIKRFLKIWGFKAFIRMLSVVTGSCCFAALASISINADVAQRIGTAIWHNESGGKIDGLTHWNAGEAFPSLGIGHFIWYPADVKARTFHETFPDLIRFMHEHREVPNWLFDQIKKGAPWISKEQFSSEITSDRMQELRQFLAATVDLQVQFILKRLHDALPLMTEQLSVRQKALVHNRFVKLARQERGIYALADYVNFKGEGTALSEQYNGIRWGLLQVLLGMDDTKDSLEAFSESAERVLKARVQAALKERPGERNEERWLPGWLKRVKGYKTICFA